MATFYDQIGANRRNSVLLAVAVTAILGVLGLLIGWALTGDPRAAIPSTLIAIWRHRNTTADRPLCGTIPPT